MAQDYMGGTPHRKQYTGRGGHRTYFLGWLNNGQSVAKAQDYMGGGTPHRKQYIGRGGHRTYFLDWLNIGLGRGGHRT